MSRQPLREYVAERETVGQSRLRAHLHGLHWNKAPLPPRFHRCWPQTKTIDRQLPTSYRCACGGYSLDGKKWISRNSRRRRGSVTRALARSRQQPEPLGFWDEEEAGSARPVGD